ncbi:recombinase family protein [Actinomadura geliboluensis]|uniref:recombinase family protein n=1 Tax=Actinomadura geliboluensis TaxID=882440 RepID=UPI0036B2FCF9
MTARPSSKISPPSARSSLPLASPTTGSTSTRDSPAPTGPAPAPTGLDQALAAVRSGDTLVVPKLDRLARSVPDARAIGDTLVARGVRLSLGGSVYDPSDPMSKMFFNMLAVFAEFEADLLKMRTR